MYADSVRGVWLVVSLSLNITISQPPHTLRVIGALDSEIEKQLHVSLWFRLSVAGAIQVFCEDWHL